MHVGVTGRPRAGLVTLSGSALGSVSVDSVQETVSFLSTVHSLGSPPKDTLKAVAEFDKCNAHARRIWRAVRPFVQLPGSSYSRQRSNVYTFVSR